MPKLSARPLAAAVCLWSLVAGAASAASTLPVSPGDRDAVLPIESRCPTFSWTSADGAIGYELVVYELAPDLADDPAAALESTAGLSVALRTQLPPRASSWTPAAARCLGRDSTYAWSVRALTADGSGEWSDPHLFEVEATPTAEELRDELDRLESRLKEVEAAGLVPLVLTGSTPTAAARASASFTPGTPPAITSVAIQGQLEDPGAATAGIEAISMSPAGVAGVFRNSGSGGQILSGQNSENKEVFKLEGDGTLSAVKFVGDGSMLTGVGGGGTAPVVGLDNTVAEASAALTLETTLMVPEAGGTLLVAGSIDLSISSQQLINCVIEINDVAVNASSINLDVDTFHGCSTHAASGVAAGTVKVELIASFAADQVFLGDGGTLWALWVPVAAAP